MHFKLLTAAALAALVLLPVRADAACCKAKGHVHEANGVEMTLQLDPLAAPVPPARQTAEVWFMQPTLIGRTIVQGRYVIEHDNDRMARGEPCTHVYAFNDRTKPVATFHCTHLERDVARTNVVGVITDSSGLKRLTEFQFAGEASAHGYPGDR